MMTTLNTSAILNEKDVENLYRQYLTKKFNDIVFNSPFGCDGYGESKKNNLRILCEFKDDLDLSLKANQVKVLSQTIYYIKKFEIAGRILPSVIFIGDRNECFVVHTNIIFNYLGMEFNWNIPPSSAHTNIDLFTLMMEDININPHVFNIKNISDCVDKVKDLSDDVKRYIPITPHNVTEVFKYFEDNVIGKNNLDTNQKANLFVQLLVNPDENYLHPVLRRKTVVTKAFKEVNLKSREVFESFFSHFSRDYTPKQREHLTAVVDRLVQDVTRRKQGEFFTPTIWVDKAHEYISSTFGENWKEKYVVWDPAWGTGNLTRDYKFQELYVSTLNYSDIQTAEQMGYNPEALKFQHDFLNDPYEFLPTNLKTAIESGRQIIVLMNPPYASSGTMNETKVKVGITQSEMAMEMKKNELGKVSNELYTQFIYRCTKMGFHVCVFSKPMFLTSPSFKNLRNKLKDDYVFKKGFMIDASEFADVKSWGLSFCVLEKTNEPTNYRSFEFDLLKSNSFEVENLGPKILYNTDNLVSASSWVREKIKGKKTIDMPQIKSALEVKQSGYGNNIENSLGYLYNDSNNVYKNSQGVCIVSSVFSHGHGVPIIKENLEEVCALFVARKLVKMTWQNEYDEYLKPNFYKDGWKEFVVNSVVYSIFSSHSQQSSLGIVNYKNNNWKIVNNFFWMDIQKLIEKSNEINFTELYNSTRGDGQRYIFEYLEQNKEYIWEESKEVLDLASDLVINSLPIRRNFLNDHNQLENWDSGFAQLKLLWKEFYVEDYKIMKTKISILEDKLFPKIYDFEFLK
jgi:hypothetical protein